MTFRISMKISLSILMLGLFMMACSQLGLQSKKETPEPSSIPDCMKNSTKEGIWPFSQVYKTWVKYDPLDYKKGSDAALMALKIRGHRIISVDRESGKISAEMVSGGQDQKTHPVDIHLIKEKASLTVHLSSKSSGSQENFCGFFEEFEKSVKRVSPPSQAKQAAPPPKKSVEPEKTSPPPSPPPPSPPPPPTETPKPSAAQTLPAKDLPQTKIVWTSVNLREGPGTNYRTAGKVTKETSLTIIEEKAGWLHVRLGNGKEAWVTKAATSEGVKLSPTPSPAPSPPPSPTVSSPKPKSPM